MSDTTNSFILNALNLPLIKDFDSLANQIGISNKLLYQLTTNTSMFYTTFTIPKRDGNPRTIQSPKYPLKMVQRWILEEILQNIPVSSHAKAFQRRINGIKENANFHRFSIYFLQMDLKDFFPSINSTKVFNVFRQLGYNYFISNLLTKLCTISNSLPQGGICSPYLSNLVCYKLDNRFKGLCSTRDVLYTRYADDLTFSSDNKETLRKIKSILEEIILDEGFKVNIKKTRFLSPFSHKIITGVTINDQDHKLKIKKEYKRNLRALIHKTITTGDYSEFDKINGYISFIDSIEQGYREKINNYIRKILEKDTKYFKELIDLYNSSPLSKEGTDQIKYEAFSLDSKDVFELHKHKITQDMYFFENVVRPKLMFFYKHKMECPGFLRVYEDLYGKEIAADLNDYDSYDDLYLF